MIELVAGLAIGLVAPRAWRVVRPRHRDPRLTARLEQVRRDPMSDEERARVAARIRNIVAEQRSRELPPVA